MAGLGARIDTAWCQLDRIQGPALPLFQPNSSMQLRAPGDTRPRLSTLAALIFSSRWLQLPLYLGLIVAQGVYVLLFVKELWHLVSH